MEILEDRSPIAVIAERTGYTRAHVRNHAHRNRERLGIRKRGKRWVMNTRQMERLARIVVAESGRKYKLGEVGPRK